MPVFTDRSKALQRIQLTHLFGKTLQTRNKLFHLFTQSGKSSYSSSQMLFSASKISAFSFNSGVMYRSAFVRSASAHTARPQADEGLLL